MPEWRAILAGALARCPDIPAWRLRCDLLRFAGMRADYYEYLADMIEGLQGRKTLRDLFDDDARRHGRHSVRGRLARRWSLALDASGGDLAAAWTGSMPAEELALLHAAQAGGADALTAALRDLARAARTVRQAWRIFRETVLTGLAALGVALVLACAVPYFTLPRLQAVFQDVPAAYHGSLTRGLFFFGEAVAYALPLLAAVAGGGAWLVWWSLPNLVGPWRRRLDGRLIWRLYRDVNAIRFLAMLAVLVRRRANVDIRLRQALAMQADHAGCWLAWHIREMIARIDAGLVGADSFDTGMIDRRIWWYLSDMIAAHGMARGLDRAADRVEGRALLHVARQAQLLRWALLLGAVAAVIALALWHYAVIDELRRALMQVHASG
ncbi:general secretion pathway protein [Bordetella genomosp. 8]|uniref:General secretion pathway protein n=1 Tax=Bordetella genomosp. 8 TaxID=1416806 RepID=A0A1W6YKD3_9BORD|nr:general secretion pathway protein [Bordetella genomosp. 8]ARP80993.1 general secretion pathway protein [Bordetella genomosp. 8]